MLHTATYDAWAAYDPTAKGTRPDGPAQQTSGNTLANKEAAISYAAARVLNDLFPVPSVCPAPPTPHPVLSHSQLQDPRHVLVDDLGYPVNTTPAITTDTAATPAGVGNLAAKAVLDFRHADGSNQLGGYAGDTFTTHEHVEQRAAHAALAAAMRPDRRRRHRRPAASEDPNSTCPDANPPKYYNVQKPLHPQWGNITPFGPLDPETHYPDHFQLSGPPNDNNDVTTALSDTSNLSDTAKVKAEYWADGPKSEFPPGHMAAFAQAYRGCGETLSIRT